MRKMNQWPWRAGLAACVAALAGCGGGGNESGPPDSLYAAPANITVTGPQGACAVGAGPTVFVYGGQPPYKLDNSMPEGMQLDKQTVTDSGQGFTITFINNMCMESIPVTIEDDVGRVFSVPVTNTKG